MASVTREAIAQSNRVPLSNAHVAICVPVFDLIHVGALPRLLSIRSGRGGPATNDRE